MKDAGGTGYICVGQNLFRLTPGADQGHIGSPVTDFPSVYS